MICCANCKVLTDNPKFCSRTCATTTNNQKNPKRKVKPRPCKKCKVIFVPSRGKPRTNICQICKNKRLNYSKVTTLGDLQQMLSAKGKHPSWKNAYVRENNRQLNKALILQGCRACGYKLHVELAHIKPITSFPLTATLAEVNSPSNVLPLCPNHHWEFDHGYLKFS